MQQHEINQKINNILDRWLDNVVYMREAGQEITTDSVYNYCTLIEDDDFITAHKEDVLSLLRQRLARIENILDTWIENEVLSFLRERLTTDEN